jgi:hypothetical protein
VNIRVGSLRGTSGDDGTISWPLSAKNLRNVDLISLTPLISVQSQYRPESAGRFRHFPSDFVSKSFWVRPEAKR